MRRASSNQMAEGFSFIVQDVARLVVIVGRVDVGRAHGAVLR